MVEQKQQTTGGLVEVNYICQNCDFEGKEVLGARQDIVYQLCPNCGCEELMLN